MISIIFIFFTGRVASVGYGRGSASLKPRVGPSGPAYPRRGRRN